MFPAAYTRTSQSSRAPACTPTECSAPQRRHPPDFHGDDVQDDDLDDDDLDGAVTSRNPVTTLKRAQGERVEGLCRWALRRFDRDEPTRSRCGPTRRGQRRQQLDAAAAGAVRPNLGVPRRVHPSRTRWCRGRSPSAAHRTPPGPNGYRARPGHVSSDRHSVTTRSSRDRPITRVRLRARSAGEFGSGRGRTRRGTSLGSCRVPPGMGRALRARQLPGLAHETGMTPRRGSSQPASSVGGAGSCSSTSVRFHGTGDWVWSGSRSLSGMNIRNVVPSTGSMVAAASSPAMTLVRTSARLSRRCPLCEERHDAV